ncbi:MAG: helix-turn-helix transcriptional regulator [Armatimonadetes bacterium]|nr:helix-turn-helix transcriptional regulator [Armatimonadota bacterium]
MKTRMPELRARHGLTQEQLAKMVGVQRETIVHLEKGRYNPSLRLAHKISRALQSTVEEVFSFEDED